MKTIPFPEEAKSIVLADDTFGFTAPDEVRCLCWLSKKTQGSILEIGCHEGRTTRELALANPDRFVIGVDYTGEEDFLCPEQKYEKPKSVGTLAASLPNVKLFDCKSSDFPDRWDHTPIGFIFVDANHTYDGVRTDTSVALEIMMGHVELGGHGGIIAWHDCYDNAPEWVGVKTFLQREIDLQKYEPKQIEGSYLAILDLRNPTGRKLYKGVAANLARIRKG